ncbi:MAG TPA: rhomboid family intramembrane serine protease, partial [Tenericutes bacterium]|nr:rhomboid family intramembrane serine protease [Mycoplasmatota bacterium]
MNDLVINQNDEIVIKLIHYFITEEGYVPIILQGAKDEVWLKNLDNDYKIIRICSNYIHNDEQLNFDIYRTKQIMKRIKKKTFTFKINALNIFVNLGDNAHIEDAKCEDNIKCAYVKTDNDIKKYNFITSVFPNITKKLRFKEKGIDLFYKITNEINEKSEKEIRKNEDIFSPKKPVVTNAIIFINTFLFFMMYIFGSGSTDSYTLLKFGANYRSFVLMGEWYRLIVSAFLHIGVWHFLFNNYALYVIGPHIESYFGKVKYIIIYLFSAICGSLLSLIFNSGISAGASGAIFGLLGSLVYFGYHYRVFIGGVIKSQIIPIILINLAIGFISTGIDNAAHIGGLIGGVLITKAVG